MALVTVQRSLIGGLKQSPHPQDELSSKRRLQKRDSFLICQGSALLLATEDEEQREQPGIIPESRNLGSLQYHMELMCNRLRPDHTITLAVRLESGKTYRVPYFLIVSNAEGVNLGESVILGMDIVLRESDAVCTIGFVLPIWSDTQVLLDGDGSFSVTSGGQTSMFKPVSVQVMWTVLQALHKACEEASFFNLVPGRRRLLWAEYYIEKTDSEQTYINDWNTMSDLISVRPPSPEHSIPTDRDLTELQIRSVLRVIMAEMDLDNATTKKIRTGIEQQMHLDLKQYKGFIENEILLALAQMDKPSQIFDHLYLGSEWNASNLEELEQNRVGFILNVTREIDNFFPAMFEYLNIRVYDEETTDLLSHWERTYRFINSTRSCGSCCLVHCKMGVSRSASTVIAYAMKEYGWDLEKAISHVKECRPIVKPNPGFLNQLRTYQGILNASKQRHNFLWRSCSETDLTDISKEPCQDQPVRRSQDDSDTGPKRSKQLPHSPRPHSPSGLSPRPHSPSGLSPRPHSPSSLAPRPHSPSGLSPRPHSPSGLSPRPHSPSGLAPRPHSPSELSPRPHSPSGLSPRPHSPSDLSPRPHSPSGLSPRPHSPSGLSPRPHSPSDLTPRPHSPSGLSPRPHSPSDSPPGSRSPSASPSTLDPTSSYHFRPLGEQPDEAPATSPLSPHSGQGRGQGSGLRVPEPLGPALRKKLDLLTLMGQVKEMERLQEAASGSTVRPGPQRAQAWRRRAYSVQGLGADLQDWSQWRSLDIGEAAFPEGAGREETLWPRSPGATPRRGKRNGQRPLHHLHQWQAVDLPEEGESCLEGDGQGPGLRGQGQEEAPPLAGGTAPLECHPGKPLQHRQSVAALQEAGLVSQRMRGFAEGGATERHLEEGEGSAPPL